MGGHPPYYISRRWGIAALEPQDDQTLAASDDEFEAERGATTASEAERRAAATALEGAMLEFRPRLRAAKEPQILTLPGGQAIRCQKGVTILHLTAVLKRSKVARG